MKCFLNVCSLDTHIYQNEILSEFSLRENRKVRQLEDILIILVKVLLQ